MLNARRPLGLLSSKDPSFELLKSSWSHSVSQRDASALLVAKTMAQPVLAQVAVVCLDAGFAAPLSNGTEAVRDFQLATTLHMSTVANEIHFS